MVEWLSSGLQRRSPKSGPRTCVEALIEHNWLLISPREGRRRNEPAGVGLMDDDGVIAELIRSKRSVIDCREAEGQGFLFVFDECVRESGGPSKRIEENGPADLDRGEEDREDLWL